MIINSIFFFLFKLISFGFDTCQDCFLFLDLLREFLGYLRLFGLLKLRGIFRDLLISQLLNL